MVTRFEMKKSAYKSFILMLVILVLAGGIWSSASDAGIIEKGEGILYTTVIVVQIILLVLAFMFSMVFFGCLVEYQGKEPGIITLGFAYVPPILYMYALGILQRFVYIFLALSVIIILYFLYSE